MVDSSQSHGPSLQHLQDVPWPPGTTQEMIDTFPRLNAREGDIYIVSYPKAGTTWTQEIVWQVLLDGKIDYRRIDIRMPWIEGMLYSYKENPYRATSAKMIENMFESFPSPRVFKSHLTYELIPKPHDKNAEPRYIYVMRNPKDTAVSYFHHKHFLPFTEDPASWDSFFEQFIKGKVNFGSWFNHVLSWWQHRDDPNILFLKYEDMKKNPRGSIGKIARFIGKDLTLETLDLIVEQTTADAMRNGVNRTNYKWFQGSKGDFVRKGVVGDWKNLFSDEQNQRFEKIFKEKMEGTGLEFEFLGIRG